MKANEWRIYRYGDCFKLVLYKTTSTKEKKKNSYDRLADFYEENLTARLPPQLWNVYDVGYYASENRKRKNEMLRPSESTPEVRLRNSISRSKARILELALCNEFKWFCTFTQSEELRDRFDLKSFRKDFSMFVRNENRTREEKIKYLLIPEQHKNGAWHMHGLLMGLTKSDLCENEYGYLDWSRYRRKFGFFSCSEIKDKTSCSKYITKYISKDFASINREAFGHLFFCSQGLKGKEVLKWDYFTKCPVDSFDFQNEYVGVKWAENWTDFF